MSEVPLNIGNASSLYFQCSALSFIPICTNSILHIVSGALLNIGKLLCTVAVICAVVLANPVGIAAVAAVAGAISAVAAVAYLAVTGVSIRDLYKSWQQVIQVKEEGLVTVQSLQPVLTPITPIAGKINYGKIAENAEGTAVGANVAEGGKVAVEDAGTSWGTKEGAAGKIADAGVKVAKDTAKVGAKIAKGGVVTGAVGGLVLGAAAGQVAQTTSLAAAQTAAEAAKNAVALAKAAEALAHTGEVGTAAAATAAQYAQAAQASVGGGLAGLIVKAGGGAQTAGVVASVTGALGGGGGEILGLLTGAAGAGIVSLAVTAVMVLGGAVIAGGALLFAGGVAVITCACCCCRSTVEIGPSKVMAQVATNSGVAKVMVEVDPSAIKDAVKTAKIPVISMKEVVATGSKKDNTEYDVIENYKPQQVSKIKWLNAPPVGGPTMKLVMAVVCVAVAVTSVVGAATPVIAIAVVSCAFYASAAGAAYVCRRKASAIKDAVKAAIGVAVVVEPYFKLLRIFP